MDIGQELRRASQQLPALPADIADRIMRALAAESDRRTEVRSSVAFREGAAPALAAQPRQAVRRLRRRNAAGAAASRTGG
jgi:hypothetical protein